MFIWNIPHIFFFNYVKSEFLSERQTWKLIFNDYCSVNMSLIWKQTRKLWIIVPKYIKVFTLRYMTPHLWCVHDYCIISSQHRSLNLQDFPSFNDAPMLWYVFGWYPAQLKFACCHFRKIEEISWLTGKSNSNNSITAIMIIESEHCIKSMREREKKTWFAMKVKFLLLPNCCCLKSSFAMLLLLLPRIYPWLWDFTQFLQYKLFFMHFFFLSFWFRFKRSDKKQFIEFLTVNLI